MPALTKIIPKGYKQTEIGVIPVDWDVSNFNGIVEKYIDYRGRTPKKLGMDWGGGDILALSANNVQMGKIDTDKEAYFGSFDLYKKWMVQGECEEGDVLLTMEAPLGNVAQIPDNRKYILSQRVLLIKPNKKITKNYLAKLLISPHFQNELFKNASGSTAQGIQRQKLDNIEIFFPESINEQNAIAAALSDIDSLIEKTDSLIEKKKAIKQGVMQELLQPYKKNGEIKDGWNLFTLFEIADNKKELFDDGDWIESEHISREGVRLIQTGNIGIGKYIEKDTKKYVYEDSFRRLNCKPLLQGDLLICRLAEPAGRSCVLPDIGEQKVITSVDVTIFRPRKEKANRYFLASLFSMDEWFKKVNESVGGTTHKRISRGSLGKIKIALPNIEQQNEGADILLDMNTEIEKLESELTKWRDMKQGMMQTLLTGKIRLIK